MFYLIVENNYPITEHRNRNLAHRSACDIQEDEIEDDANRTVIAPDRSIINADIV